MTTIVEPVPRAVRLQSVWRTINGLRLHARVSPYNAVLADAPAVVLVHGLGVSSRYLVPTAERLAPSFRVYAPDLPGSGRSAKPDHVLDVPELANALAGWMDRAGVERAALLGNSLGCQTIVEFALRHPDRIERAILIGPTIDPQARTLARILGRGLRDLFNEPLWYWFLMTTDYLETGPLHTLRTLRLALRDRPEQKLPYVRVPTLVVRGEYDRIAPLPWAEEVTRLLPEGRLVVVPGVAHVPHCTAPQRLVPVVREFCAHVG
jgi:pimeloyl-ACP methyl ester carboxylesterase